MKTTLFKAGALALAVLFSFAGLAYAGELSQLFSIGSVPPDMAQLFTANVLPLAALRTNLADLKAEASALVDKIGGAADEAAIRAIEAEHGELTTQIRTLTLEIKQRAAEEEAANPAPGAAPADPSAETTRAAQITDLAVRAGKAELAAGAIKDGVTVEAFRAQLFDEMLDKQPKLGSQARSQIMRDGDETTRAAMVEALAYGVGAPLPAAGPSEAARSFMGKGLIELAADRVGYQSGRIINARQIDDILTRASHATSDFPAIFENALNKALEGRYALAEPTFKAFARRRDFKDFRPHNSVSVGDFPMLQEIAQHGEIKSGTFSDGKETVSVLAYGRKIQISRQMLINDDLGAIADLLASYGATVALFEEVTFYATAFNGKLADGKTVFHADHRNLATAGAAISVDSVALGRAAMAKQKTKDGNPLLSNRARFILTGPDYSTDAEKLVASVTPANSASVNPFSGKLIPIETSQISGKAWHLLGDPVAGSNWRWGYLEGYEAPRVRMDTPFGTQGFGMSVEHDFGAGAVDHRFGYMNAGA